MTTNNSGLVSSLQALIRQSKEGLTVQELQPMLYARFKLKISYRDIEQTLWRNSTLFSEIDWKWISREA